MEQRNGKTAEQNLKSANGGREWSCQPESYNSNRNEFYNMNNKYRGKALIFSHDDYDSHLELPPRIGNVRDRDNLDKCLQELGFSVDVFSNQTCGQVMEHIKRTAEINHAKNDCLLIAVLTHGGPEKLYAKDTHYSPDKLWNRFTEENCPSLAGKPKLFVFQACQGEEYDDGVTLEKYLETDGWFEPHKSPTYPDFLLVRSTVPGYYSWRNTSNGSWFIQALCEELYYSATDTDILTLLTFVNQKVALNFRSSTFEVASNKKKQVPCFSSMLTRRLVFTKKPDSSSSKNSILHCFK